MIVYFLWMYKEWSFVNFYYDDDVFFYVLVLLLSGVFVLFGGGMSILFGEF